MQITLTSAPASGLVSAALLRYALLLLLLAGFGLEAHAQKAASKVATATTPIKVYLVGTFHFNGSNDVVKGSRTATESPQTQQELEDLANRLAKTKADKVFVEWMPTRQAYVDSTYALYRKGRFTLKNNEVYQVGYRLANKLNRPRVICADADGEFDYSAAVAYAKQHGQYDILANSEANKPAADSVGRLIEARIRAIHGPDKAATGKTITDLIVSNNTDAALREMMSWYQLTGARVGGAENFVGADLGGDFYKRNMRIYATMLRHIDVQHDKSVILIIGAGHVGFLKQVLQYNPLFEVQDVLPLLTAKTK